MSEKLKNLVKTAGEQHTASEKFAEQKLLEGQLIGKGMTYELFEKEGAPFAKWLASLTKIVKSAPKKIDIGARGLGGKIIAKTKGYKPGAAKFIARKKKRLVGYGLPAAGAIGLTGGGIAIGKRKKAKEASVKTAADLILRYAED